MDEQKKLRNLLSYTKTDSVEGLEEVNKLYEELLAHINKAKKEHELLGLYQRMYDTPIVYKALRTQIVGRILQLEKELGEMK